MSTNLVDDLWSWHDFGYDHGYSNQRKHIEYKHIAFSDISYMYGIAIKWPWHERSKLG